METQKLIIVTGGAGLIGSAIVWQLNQMGLENIVIVDHLGESEKWQNLRALRFLDYMEKDKFIEKVIDKSLPFAVDTVFHMGACSSTTEKDATYLIKNNFAYTCELAMCALNRKARFIYASSAATYGDGAMGYGDDEKEINRLRPLNMYGYSKQLFDQWAVNHGLINHLVGLKFFNVFGPNEWHKGSMRSMILKAFEQIEANGEVTLFKSYKKEFGDGEQLRDFIYVKDAAKMAIHFFKNREEAHNGLFNIGTGQARNWNDLANSVFAALGIKSNIRYIEMPPEIKGKYQYYTQADTTKLVKSGYSDKPRSLEEAIKDYVLNYLIGSRHLGDETE